MGVTFKDHMPSSPNNNFEAQEELGIEKSKHAKSLSIIQEKNLNTDFLETSNSHIKIKDHFSIELFNNKIFSAGKTSLKSVRGYLDVWRGASDPSSNYQNIVGVINQKTGVVMLSLNHEGIDYTIQPNGNNTYSLRQIRSGNPD